MARITYNNKNAVFFPSLKLAVDQYFNDHKLKKTGDWRLYLKTLILVLSATGLYVSVLTIAMPAWLLAILSLILGFVFACIGFNVMHDANHGSYSTKKWVNDLLGLTLNALGGNSFIWKQKHNVIHHTYTNVDGIDDDIAKSPFIRMCSTQTWVPMHRVQHLYTPFLYGISSMIWVLFQDFEKYFKRKVHTTGLSKMSATDHLIFWFSKLMYAAFYIILPIVLIGWKTWLLFFISMHLGLGFTLAIVFQLAHVVEETEFEFAAIDESKMIDNEWAIHQVRTTADFSPNSKIISWLVGGLNYQIEHHLFPRISHIHYPALSQITRAKCQEFGLPYHCMPTFSQAVHSHFRFLKSLGRKSDFSTLAS